MRNRFMRVVVVWVVVLPLLWAASTGVALAKAVIPGGVGHSLALEGAGAARSGVTEHQIRQLLAASPDAQEVLLAAMARQIHTNLGRLKPSRWAVPESLLVGWLNSLLKNRVAPGYWAQHLEERVLLHAELRQRMASIVSRRVGVDDPLIRANEAITSGELGRASALLDGSALVAVDPNRPRPANLNLDRASLLAARGLVLALQEEVEGAKRLLLEAADLLAVDDREKPRLLLLAGSVVAISPAKHDLAAVSRLIQTQAEAALQRRPMDSSWRRALWIAHLWTGMEAASREDWLGARRAFSDAVRSVPTDDDRLPVDWGGIWVSRYVLAVVPESAASAEHHTDVAEALRVSRRMTDLRPDWVVGWRCRALSDVAAAISAMNRGELASSAPFLRDAMQSLDRLKTMGDDSTVAQETRLQALMLMQMEQLERDDEVQYRQLSAAIAELVSELQGRGLSVADASYAGLAFALKLQESEYFRKREQWDRVVKVLSEALPLVERNVGKDHEQREFWEVEGWHIHVLLADATENAGSAQTALLHRRKAVEKADQALAREPGAEWQVRQWESLEALARTLSAMGLLDEASRLNEQVLPLARRQVAVEGPGSDWARRLLRALMTSAETLHERGDGLSARARLEDAEKVAWERYRASPKASQAAQDLWLVKNAIGEEELKLGRHELSAEAHREALKLADARLREEAASDDWLDRAATSHTGLAEVAESRQDRPLEAMHRRASVELSSKRSIANRSSSYDQSVHWLRLYHHGLSLRATKRLDLAEKALTEARDLARRFASQLPGDRDWQEYLWYSENTVGTLMAERGELASAEAALLAATAVAESMVANGGDQRLWWDHAADSLEALAQVRAQGGQEVEGRRATQRASDFRSRLYALEREERVRADVKGQLAGLVNVLGLSEADVERLSKKDLLTRLETAIDRTTGWVQANGMSSDSAERLRLLRNTLFAVRQLPD